MGAMSCRIPGSCDTHTSVKKQTWKPCSCPKEKKYIIHRQNLKQLSAIVKYNL